jgi:hypothetical protein
MGIISDQWLEKAENEIGNWSVEEKYRAPPPPVHICQPPRVKVSRPELLDEQFVPVQMEQKVMSHKKITHKERHDHEYSNNYESNHTKHAATIPIGYN